MSQLLRRSPARKGILYLCVEAGNAAPGVVEGEVRAPAPLLHQVAHKWPSLLRQRQPGIVLTVLAGLAVQYIRVQVNRPSLWRRRG